MEQKEQEPFDREAWRKLLGAETGAPTKEMDLRILAEARRALAPRIGRWWLPASLAASLLLAVLIVQSQLADFRKPAAVTEADVPATPATGAIQDNDAPFAITEVPVAPQDAPASAITSSPPPSVDLPSHEWTGAPAAAPPAAEAPAPATAAEPATSADEERVLSRNQTEVAKSASDAAAAAAPAPAQAQSGAESGRLVGMLKSNESYAESRTPEQWYADIEARRAAGRIKEADAELARFKSKYPGWLESHQKKDP